MTQYTAFAVDFAVSGEIALVTASGELDLNTTSAFADTLVLAEQRPEVKAIVCDLRALTFVDSTGLKVILEAMKRSDTNGHRFAFVGVGREVRRIFQITGLEEVLDREDGAGMLHRFAGATARPDGSS